MNQQLKIFFERLKIYFETDRNYKISLIAASVTLFFVIWFSSGTLSPYALSAPDELALNQFATVDADMWASVIPGGREALQCRYVANLDHGQFLQPFLMLDGVHKSVWEESVYLRRILYPLIGYPFIKLMGFETGGFVLNVIIHFITFFLFVSFIRREVGREAAIFAAWAVATFPGVAYFGGLPYSHALIVPGCLVMTMLLWNLARATELKTIFLLSLGLGVVFTGYDFLPIFGFAAVFILLRRKLFVGAVASVVAMMAPIMLFNLVLKYYYEAELTNSNNEMFQIIAFSYLGVFQGFFESLGIDPNSSVGLFLQENSPFPDTMRWWGYVKLFPVYLLFNYVFSTFAYLSVGFALVNVPRLFGKRLKLNSVEFGVLLAVFLIFVFNNLAPPYRSWQFRQYGFARIYEPMFVVLILYLARKVQTLPELPLLRQRMLKGLIYFVLVGNLITSFSTVLPNNMGLGIYGNFYLQNETTRDAYSNFKERIKKFGKYPIGTCGHMKEAKVVKNK